MNDPVINCPYIPVVMQQGEKEDRTEFQKRLSEAIKIVSKELSEMPFDEFSKKIDEVAGSDRAKALYYAWNPDWDGSDIS